MGGAIAVHVAVQKLLPSLAGLAVIDVVEGKEPKVPSKIIIFLIKTGIHMKTKIHLIPMPGTAMEALSSMQSFLRGRPSSFQSLEQGIEWW